MSRLFRAKAWLGGVGLAIGLAGMALRFRWLVGIAAGLLTVAFVLRFAERKSEHAS
ncbi:MAG: hypothetical protein HYS40_09235 [Gemmatimonadetes bacterium]|nr:hypothetical protein [Gemmatimonadota bacterium]